MKKIIFLGSHGQFNIGDELLQETFLRLLGKDHFYFVNSYSVKSTKEQLEGRYKVSVFHTKKESWKLPFMIVRSEYVFFAGGSTIKELYKSVGRNRFSSMLMILGVVFLSKILRTKVVMSNVGLGPIETKFGIFLAKLILRHTDFISLRDKFSYDLCLKLKRDDKNVFLVPDIAFINTKEDFKIGTTKQVGKTNETLQIALNINHNIANGDNWEYFINQLGAGLESLLLDFKIQINYLPMQFDFNEKHDLKMLDMFALRFPKFEYKRFEPKNANDIAKIISDSDIVVAERLHALIISTILAKPFIALKYDVKVTELCKDLGMAQYSIDINSKFEASHVGKSIKDVNISKKEIREQLEKETVDYRRQLNSYLINLRSVIK